MKKFLTLFAIACLTQMAHARDSSHFSCAGFLDSAAESGPDNYGFAVQLDESRGPVIEVGDESIQTRDELLSVVWAGSLYQGRVRKNEEATFGEGRTKLENATTKKFFFAGTYALDVKKGTLKLEGGVNLSPNDKDSEVQKISTTLKCVDLSN
ncbi:MAG TPA: hypothetical protein VM901_09105 [Bdellovibrionota bacterium]|jgi:hypothetical protein|nr:hypothetical protein [Bdellovibrionota bacterium]